MTYRRFIILVVGLAILIAIVLPKFKFGKNKYDYQFRKNALRQWRIRVCRFMEEEQYFPQDLTEVYTRYKEEIARENIPIVLRRLTPREEQKLKEDARHFEEIVFYQLKGEGGSWYIQERYPSTYGTLFIIDNHGIVTKSAIK